MLTEKRQIRTKDSLDFFSDGPSLMNLPHVVALNTHFNHLFAFNIIFDTLVNHRTSTAFN